MFSFFKKKSPSPPSEAPTSPANPATATPETVALTADAAAVPAPSIMAKLKSVFGAAPTPVQPPAPTPPAAPAATPAATTPASTTAVAVPSAPTPPAATVAAPTAVTQPLATVSTAPESMPTQAKPERTGWLDKLKAGLKKTGSAIATVFTGTQIDDALYEELETALLMADTSGFYIVAGKTQCLGADLQYVERYQIIRDGLGNDKSGATK
jgi:fused signal recognition particle receptor